jgi:hypothetical protein
VLVDDCTAARHRRAHEATIENVRTHFGLVATADEIEQIWRQAAEPVRAAARAV